MANARADRRSPRQASYWLWMLAIGMASALAALVVANAFLPADRAVTRGALGQDFLAFYSAGQLVDSGRSGELYDLTALSTLQQSIADRAGFRPASDVAPWWNPPHVAWLFVPLAGFSFYTALTWWTAFNIACLAGAATLLANVIRSTSERKRDWLLVPALLAVAPPTIQALGHGQNTGLSLLMLSLVVVAWRARRPLLTGVACALLCYKPQLGAVVGLAAFATLGWRVAVGALVVLVPLLLATLRAMPGALGDFIIRVPANLRAIQFAQPYLWHRHATFEGFLRFALQGNAAGVTRVWIHGLALAGIGITLATLTFAGWKLRDRARRQPDDADLALDRFVALVILATPLAMPFFFDYDLLLLAIPCVLIARDMMIVPEPSRITGVFKILSAVTFVWLACNPPLAESAGLNLTVPMLVGLVALHARRCIVPPVSLIEGQAVAKTDSEQTTVRLAA